MKTTVEISDALLQKARRLANKRKTTLRAILEQGILLALSQEKEAKFNLEDCSVKGNGVAAEFEHAPWESWRKAAYGERE